MNSSFALRWEAGDEKQATKARIQKQKSEEYPKLPTKGNTGTQAAATGKPRGENRTMEQTWNTDQLTKTESKNSDLNILVREA